MAGPRGNDGTRTSERGQPACQRLANNEMTTTSAGLASSPRQDRPLPASRRQWKQQLGELLEHAEHRFGDLRWVLADGTQIWAHKAIVYSRSSARFKAKFLASASHSNGKQNASPSEHHQRERTPSDRHVSNGTTTTTVKTSVRLDDYDVALLKAHLLYFYTAERLRDVDAFLSDEPDEISTAPHLEAQRIERLSEDFLYLWRSQLFADVKLTIEDENDGSAEGIAMSAHRAILCSRCTYFSALVLSPYADSHQNAYALPSPPFTRQAIHFVLGYFYCGSVRFTSKTVDLATAMQIWRCAEYLGSEDLKTEIEREIESMCHGFRNFTGASARRAAKIFAFCESPDVFCRRLQEGSRKVVTTAWGEAWAQEIGALDQATQQSLVLEVCAHTTATTLCDAIRAKRTLQNRIDAHGKHSWAQHLAAMLEPISERVTTVVQTSLDDILCSPSFTALLSGVDFSDDALEELFDTVGSQPTIETAATTYVALCKHRATIEHDGAARTREASERALDRITRFLKARWPAMHQAGSFAHQSSANLQDIADALHISVADLTAHVPKQHPHKSRLPATDPTRPSRLLSTDSKISTYRKPVSRAESASVIRTTRREGGASRAMSESQAPSHARSLGLAGYSSSPRINESRKTTAARPTSAAPVMGTHQINGLSHAMSKLATVDDSPVATTSRSRAASTSNQAILEVDTGSPRTSAAVDWDPTEHGTELSEGIPCVVMLDHPPGTKLRASVHYLGEVHFAPGAWVGLEVHDETLPVMEEDIDPALRVRWTDGSVDGIRYFATSLALKRLHEAFEADAQSQQHMPSGSHKQSLFVRPDQVVYVF
ncbi:uncharacterized protein L969DRAFT_93634 [Mixia osmundae IAM 14324]|uniref:BTB domain-containing protein n=1 Tax=Mixia osmundae (strain CBS 9802 / IAM 14324 / JCM 22182 / KY 12970) TaxID=764103 RepID=G7E953_MIXOS|nr:uncharacterized protein L969DRAFT_93634 [Mixia osmundae IAM 14324]KEI39792.1 hypothetical protein L969DRAFT_93634 [Mixia osmundae IAM 14324]GAA99172.1 hypothetical protein E5Q_05864 [Mixia osmundae IAM 14324]